MRAAPKHRRFNFKWIGWIFAGLAVFWTILTAYEIHSNSIFLNRNWQVNVVFATNPVTVLAFPKKADEPTVVVLPKEVYIDVPFGYGQYRAEAVAPLAKLEKKGDLLVQSISDTLSVPISSWVMSSSTIEDNSNELTRLQNSFSWTEVFANPALSNLKWWDRSILKWKLSRTRSVRSVDLGNYPNILQPFQLGDNTQAQRFNKEALFGILLTVFEDPEVRQENLIVEVFNTTGTPLVGEKFSRFVSLMGGKVIGLKNDTEEISNCIVTTQEKAAKSKLVEFVTREFGCNVVVSNEIGVDLQIKVGQVWAKRWSVEN